MDEFALMGWINEAHCRESVAGVLARLNAMPDELTGELRAMWRHLPDAPSRPELDEFDRELTAVEGEYFRDLEEGGWV